MKFRLLRAVMSVLLSHDPVMAKKKRGKAAAGQGAVQDACSDAARRGSESEGEAIDVIEFFQGPCFSELFPECLQRQRGGLPLVCDGSCVVMTDSAWLRLFRVFHNFAKAQWRVWEFRKVYLSKNDRGNMKNVRELFAKRYLELRKYYLSPNRPKALPRGLEDFYEEFQRFASANLTDSHPPTRADLEEFKARVGILRKHVKNGTSTPEELVNFTMLVNEFETRRLEVFYLHRKNLEETQKNIKDFRTIYDTLYKARRPASASPRPDDVSDKLADFRVVFNEHYTHASHIMNMPTDVEWPDD